MNGVSSILKGIFVDNNINITTNYMKMRHFQKDFSYGPDKHSFVELNYVCEGTCYMIMGNDIICYGQNQCMIIYPDVSHSFQVTSAKGCKLAQLEFSIDSFPELMMEEDKGGYFYFIYDLLTNARRYIKILGEYRIKNCIERIIAESSKATEESLMLVNLYYVELMVILSSAIKSTMNDIFSSKNPYVEYCINKINSEYNEDITVEKLAQGCGISSRYLRTVFRQNTGFKLIEYITAIRIRKAKKLLNDSNYTLTDIAIGVGYSSAQYFNKVFKCETGMTPGEYRKMLFRKI